MSTLTQYVTGYALDVAGFEVPAGTPVDTHKDARGVLQHHLHGERIPHFNVCSAERYEMRKLLPVSVRTDRQFKVLTRENVTVSGQRYKLVKAKIRFDDECKNGHNSFAITGEFYETQREINKQDPSMCGCCHEELVKVFPELAPLIKWHLVSADEPMHYIANTTYHASDRDYRGKVKGEPYNFETRIVVGDSPIKHLMSKPQLEFINATIEAALQSDGTEPAFKPLAVKHKDNGGSGYQYSDHYTFAGLDCEWHQCKFDNEADAQTWCDILNKHVEAVRNGSAFIKFEQHPTAWGEGKEPDLEAARRAACWPDATLEQLRDVELLKARLPGMMDELKQAVESLGMVY